MIGVREKFPREILSMGLLLGEVFTGTVQGEKNFKVRVKGATFWEIHRRAVEERNFG